MVLDHNVRDQFHKRSIVLSNLDFHKAFVLEVL